MFIEAFIALLGAREVHRHTNALKAIEVNGERHAYERWGRQWARVWGAGAILIGMWADSGRRLPQSDGLLRASHSSLRFLYRVGGA